MGRLVITKEQACRLMLTHQGLHSPHEFHGKKGVLDYIKRVGCIQYDALNIVGRNPELVLQARVPDFRPSMLHELLYRERRLLDGIDKEMSIYCVEDWPCFRRTREAALKRFGDDRRPIVPFLSQIRQKIEEQGPLASSDLEFDQIVDWSWGPTRLARAALESMYHWGELTIHHKVNTRKVYDFSHRHIAGELLTAPDPNGTESQYHDWCVLRRIGAVGLLWGRSGDAWRRIHGIDAAERRDSLARLLKNGKIMELEVEGVKHPFYMRASDRPRLESALESPNVTPRAVVLAPLDNLLWDRQLINTLFDFEYTWEVYKPPSQRRYGYYVLPVLYGDRFIARFEPGRDKQSGALLIKNWWWEPETSSSEETQSALKHCFEQFLNYLSADSLLADSRLTEKKGLGFLALE